MRLQARATTEPTRAGAGTVVGALTFQEDSMPSSPAEGIAQGMHDIETEPLWHGSTCTGDPDLDPDELVYEGPVEPDGR